MSWFAIEIVLALAPLAVLLGWTVHSLRRRARDERQGRDADDAA